MFLSRGLWGFIFILGLGLQVKAQVSCRTLMEQPKSFERVKIAVPYYTQASFASEKISFALKLLRGQSTDPLKWVELQVSNHLQPNNKVDFATLTKQIEEPLKAFRKTIYEGESRNRNYRFDFYQAIQTGTRLQTSGLLNDVAGWLMQKQLPYAWVLSLDLSNPVHFQRLADLSVDGGLFNEQTRTPFFQFLISSGKFEVFMGLFFHNDFPAMLEPYRKYSKDHPFLDFEAQLLINIPGILLEWGSRNYGPEVMSGKALLTYFTGVNNWPEVIKRWSYLDTNAERIRVVHYKNTKYKDFFLLYAGIQSDLYELAKNPNFLNADFSRKSQDLAKAAKIYRMFRANPFLFGLKHDERLTVHAVIRKYMEESGLLENPDLGIYTPMKFAASFGQTPQFDIFIELDSFFDSPLKNEFRGQSSFRTWGWWDSLSKFSLEKDIPAERSQSLLSQLHGKLATREIRWINTLDYDRNLNLDSMRVAINSVDGKPVSMEVFVRESSGGAWRPLAFEIREGELIPLRELLGKKTGETCKGCHQGLSRGIARPVQMRSESDFNHEFGATVFENSWSKEKYDAFVRRMMGK